MINKLFVQNNIFTDKYIYIILLSLNFSRVMEFQTHKSYTIIHFYSAGYNNNWSDVNPLTEYEQNIVYRRIIGINVRNYF